MTEVGGLREQLKLYLLQSRPRPRGGRGRGGGGPGGRRGKERSQPNSAEELDADLEKYHADVMQTN